MNALHAAALAAVAELGENWTGGAQVIQAMRIVRERTSVDLHTARAAVHWAIGHPPADSLPVGSVVASESDVWIKTDGLRSAEPGMPWITAAGGAFLNIHGDEEVTDMIQSDEVTVLRVGTGS